jgi:multidrug resistance efflux pump
MRKRLLFVLVLLVAAGAGYYAYARSRTSTLMLTGIVTTNDVIVSPQIAGQIGDLFVKEGDTVTRDQVVAVIRPDELQADTAYYRSNVAGLASQVRESEAALRYQEQQTADQIRQAEAALASTEAQVKAANADLENARLTFSRTQDLAQQKVASPQELDQSRTTFNSAQAKVDALNRQVDALNRQVDVQRAAVALARSNAEQTAVRRSQVQASEHMQAAAAAQQVKANVRLQYTEIKAPIDGIVDVRAARAGEYVQAGQPVVTLINPDDLWIRADVEETYIDRVRLGDTMTIRLPSGDERQGTVFYRGVDAGFATQRDVSRTKRDIKTFEVRLRADNADRRLAVGMTAYVLLPIP